MALIQHWFYSKALTECSCLYVVIPVERHPKKTYPVLWLLPRQGMTIRPGSAGPMWSRSLRGKESWQ